MSDDGEWTSVKKERKPRRHPTSPTSPNTPKSVASPVAKPRAAVPAVKEMLAVLVFDPFAGGPERSFMGTVERCAAGVMDVWPGFLPFTLAKISILVEDDSVVEEVKAAFVERFDGLTAIDLRCVGLRKVGKYVSTYSNVSGAPHFSDLAAVVRALQESYKGSPSVRVFDSCRGAELYTTLRKYGDIDDAIVDAASAAFAVDIHCAEVRLVFAGEPYEADPSVVDGDGKPIQSRRTVASVALRPPGTNVELSNKFGALVVEE